VLAGGVPVLGICYGMQLLGLAEGAGLHQHLPEDRPGARSTRGVVHAVRAVAGSKLARLLEVDEVAVVSRHHQALSRVELPWRVAALDAEGLVEAIEREDHPFAVGVQWHPELAPEGSPHDRLFRGSSVPPPCAAGARPRRGALRTVRVATEPAYEVRIGRGCWARSRARRRATRSAPCSPTTAWRRSGCRPRRVRRAFARGARRGAEQEPD
jgi:hypothetical protein